VHERSAKQVRAEHHQLDRIRDGDRPNIYRRLLFRYQRGDVEGDGILKRSRQHGDPELRLARRACRHSHRAQIEQIAEVRVRAHPGVGADRVGGHLVDARVHRSSGHHQRVDAVQFGHRDGTQPVDLAAVVHQPVRRDIARRADDAPHCRIQRGVWLRVDEFAYGGVPFAHQRAVVQQLGRGKEWCDVDRDGARARLGQSPDGGVERGPPLPVQLGQLVGHRNDGSGRRPQPDIRRPVTGSRTGRHPAHRPVRQREVGRENRYAVIGFACGHHAVGADDPEGGFDSDDALQACGHAS
jgi:hypothetical protein